MRNWLHFLAATLCCPLLCPGQDSPTTVLLRPPPLRSGDTIFLVSPGSPSGSSDLEEAANNLRQQGYRVKISPLASRKMGYLAGADEARSAELNSAFADPEVRLILCARGGYGSPRILDQIDYDLIRRSPKVIVGYSDITALLIAIRKQTGLVVFHGPMAAKDFSGHLGGLAPFASRHLFSLIGSRPFQPGAEPFIDWGKNPPGGAPRRTLVAGVAEGPLIGGNLSTVAALMGTAYEIDTAGAILFLEDVNEEPFRIDRMLCQLRLAGKLRTVAGVLLGGFTSCSPRSPSESLTLEEVFSTYFVPLGVPVLSGFPAGHLPQQATLPFGTRVRLDASRRTLSLLEPAVE